MTVPRVAPGDQEIMYNRPSHCDDRAVAIANGRGAMSLPALCLQVRSRVMVACEHVSYIVPT